MKQQILTQKLSMLIFTALFFIYNIPTMSYAHRRVEFVEGDTTTREIAENTPADTNIGEPLRYSTNLPDECIGVSFSGPNWRAFDVSRVAPGSLQLKTKSRLNYEKKNTYEVRVTVLDWGSPATDVITVNITVTDVNEAPTFVEAKSGVNPIRRSIPENTAAGTNIGDPVSAIDPDGSDVILTYNLEGTDANIFEIDSGTGQLMTHAPLDYEAFRNELPAYSVKVKVFDGVPSSPETASAEIEVSIAVEPVSEFAPAFTEGDETTREIEETAAVGTNVGDPVSATDADMGETLEYSLDDNQDDAFEIDSRTGQLKTKTALDHETEPNYKVKVVVSDGSQIDSIIVTINVLPEETVASAPTIKADKTTTLLKPALLKSFDTKELQARLQRLYAENDGTLKYQRAIVMLESVLASTPPDKTVLLANYPNPFNPETWIPYRLAKAANVQIPIYNAHGTVVRHLELGHQSAGYYISRNRAAYWDGKNNFGESVASGIYFYQLQADTVSSLRKMVILK